MEQLVTPAAHIVSYVNILGNPTASEGDRIDACHALGHGGGNEAVAALVSALGDSAFGVRWAAAKALHEHGRKGIVAALEALLKRPDPFVYEGVHHVLKHAADPDVRHAVKPVVEALEHGADRAYAPVAAGQALEALRKL